MIVQSEELDGVRSKLVNLEAACEHALTGLVCLHFLLHALDISLGRKASKRIPAIVNNIVERKRHWCVWRACGWISADSKSHTDD